MPAFKINPCQHTYFTSEMHSGPETLDWVIVQNNPVNLVDPWGLCSGNNSYQIDNVVITHYDNCKLCTGKSPGDPGYGITKDGTTAAVGTVAADPIKIPMESSISFQYPDGTTFNGVVHDIGGKVKGYRIDIWVPTHQEAITKGRLKNVTITVTPP